MGGLAGASRGIRVVSCCFFTSERVRTNDRLAGMRFAKLENNIITAYFVATFDFHLEDKSGKMLRFAPRVDPNGHSACKPAVRQYVRVSPREK